MTPGLDLAPPLLLGVDVGTQTTRVLAFDRRGRHLATASRPTPTQSLCGSGGDYDPQRLWTTVETCLAEIVVALPAGVPVAGIAVASVGESCVLVDAAGQALAPALVWFDRRTEAAAAAIEAAVGRQRLFALTGQRADSTFGLCKLVWMREQWPDAFGRAVRVLNVADWIAFKLCGVAATDFTLASRTLALDIHRRCWSPELLEALGLSASLFAPLQPSGTPLGPVRQELAARLGFSGQPVVGVGAHDHLCGLFAAGAARPGALLDSLGTAEALLLATAEPLRDPAILDRGYFQGLVQTDRQLAYVGAGINASGGAIEWFRGLFAGGATRSDLIGEAAAVRPGAGGVGFVPHLAYAPAPHPDTAARGAFTGLTLAASRGALFRAVLEGLAFEARQMLEGMSDLPGANAAQEIRVIGGNSRNPLLLDIKASVFARPLTVVDQPEATALGAAILGGLAAGVWRDLDGALAEIEQPVRTVAPNPQWTELYDRYYRETYVNLYPALRTVRHEGAI